MKKSFQLMCKTFYDISFVRDYIKNGNGTGTGFLAFVALIMSFITTIIFALQISIIFDSEQTNVLLDKFLESTPPVIIENGELQYQDNVLEKYTLRDLGFDDLELEPEENMNLLTIDTQNDYPSFTAVKDTVFYITKKDIYVHNPENGEVKNIELSRIQKMFNQDRVELTSKNNMAVLVKFLQWFAMVVIAFVFIFGFLFDWLINVVLAIITRFFAKITNKSLEKLAPTEIRRVAAVAVTPILILIATLQAIFMAPGSLVKWFAVIIVGIILANKYVPAEEKTKEENTDTHKS